MMPTGEQEKRLEARVRGYVQGVGFRDFVERAAQARGVRGSVWNGHDGAVYVLAEGPPASLESLLATLHQGPRLARVQGVDASWGAARGNLPDPFEVGR